MDELAEVKHLRAHIPAPDTGKAFAALAGAMREDRATTAPRPARRRRLGYLAGVVAATTAVAAGTILSLPAHPKAPASSSIRPAIRVQPGPGRKIPQSAAELVAYAARAAARSAVTVPNPHDWMYIDELDRGPCGPVCGHGHRSQTWQQVGFGRAAELHGGKLSYGGGGGPHTQLTGWPVNDADIYRYLATLPVKPTELRKVILANNHSNPGKAFAAIEFLMDDFALPPRFQAELYAVAVTLPGVRFDRSATDAAGRNGVGLYMIQDAFSNSDPDGFLKEEIIVNPRTYDYMGLLWVAVKARTEHGTNPAVLHIHKGEILGWTAILSSGIVSRAGQLP